MLIARRPAPLCGGAEHGVTVAMKLKSWPYFIRPRKAQAQSTGPRWCLRNVLLYVPLAQVTIIAPCR
jgi:hypothetical protein